MKLSNDTNDWLRIRQGGSPLIVSIPHAGTEIPSRYLPMFRSEPLARFDTDWHLRELYSFTESLDVTIISTSISRSVIDINRDPEGILLYPGMPNTALVPLETFDGESLYEAGAAPSDKDVESRRIAFHVPYHDAIRAEIQRLKKIHRNIVIYDAHSIRSSIPRLFEGILPHLNLGTNGGQSCANEFSKKLLELFQETTFTFVADGRFKGGYITRKYGRPDQHVHALQLELACRSYLDEPHGAVDLSQWPPLFDSERAAPLQVLLFDMLRACIDVSRRLT